MNRDMQCVRRPENIALTAQEQACVMERVAATGSVCHWCAGVDFRVGDALPLGFLFLDEQPGTFMAALTCTNPSCPSPHTGITLHERHFRSTPTRST